LNQILERQDREVALMGTGAEEPERTLLRAAYLLQRELMTTLELCAGTSAREALPTSDPAAGGAQRLHDLHRLRVFQATLTTWLEEHERAWLTDVRGAEAELHRAQLGQLQAGGAGPEQVALRGHIDAREGRLRDVLRAADRLTFSSREVDLHGAAMLTGLAPATVRGAIERGELQARDDGDGPLVRLDVLARFAEARGLAWDDGLEDAQAGDAQERRLQTLRARG